jgi:hypothetical protein
VVAVVLSGYAVAFKADKPHFRSIFVDFGLKVPPAVDRLDAIPNSVYALATTGVIVLAVSLQVFLRRRGVASLLHLAVLSVVVLAYAAYYGPVLMPLVQLINRLSD